MSFRLNAEQTKHLNHVQGEFAHRLAAKYTKGAEEHGGDLQDMNELELVENAIEECIDQFTYLLTARDKLLNGS